MSNLFDILHSVHNEDDNGELSRAVDPQRSGNRVVDPDTCEHVGETETTSTAPVLEFVEQDQEIDPEDVLDINAFKTKFTIPKKKSQHRQVFETISIESRQFQHEIDTILRQSFKDRNAHSAFVYTRCQLIHQEPLIKEYAEKRKHFKKENYSDKETQDTYVFINCDTESEARLYCTEGMKVNNTRITCLGNPELGVYMSKHADLISPNSFRPGQFGRIVIFKAMKGKVKSMVENRSGTPLDPTPNYDCHVSKMASVDLSSTSPQYAFESNQIYFYEYDDCFEIVQRPRQIVPHALIHFRYYQADVSKKLRLPPQLTPVNIGKPSSGSQSSRSSTSSRRSSQSPLSSKRPALLPTPTTMPSLLTSPSPLMTTPSPPAMGKSRQVDKTPPLPVIKTRVGKEVENGQGVIVWTGQLANGDINLCTIDMLAYGTAIKPALFGQQLTITKMLPWTTVMTVLFNNLLTLPRNTETIAAGRYFSYYKVVPGSGDEDILRTIIDYFQQKESAGYVDLEQVKGILLPNCQITQNLGLSGPDDSGDILHCVFISSQSRQQLLKGRVSIPNGSGSISNGGYTTYNIANTTASSGINTSYSLGGTPTTTPSPTGPHDSRSPGANVGEQGNVDMPALISMGSSLFRDPPVPRRMSGLSLQFPDPDFFYEGGFKTVPPSTCLVVYRVLHREFVDQMALQDKRNIDVARGKYRARVTSTQGPSLSIAEPKAATTSVWGQKGYSPISKKQTVTKVSEIVPMAAAPDRDPRVQRRKNQGLLKTISDFPKPDQQKQLMKSMSDGSHSISGTEFSKLHKFKTVSPAKSSEGIVTGFGTAQTFDFIPEETFASFSRTSSDNDTGITSMNSPVKLTRQDTQIITNKLSPYKEGAPEVTRSLVMKPQNETVAVEPMVSTINPKTLSSPEGLSKSKVPLIVSGDNKKLVSEMFSVNSTVIERLKSVSLLLSNKKKETMFTTRSIISLPLPPGEEISKDDIIIETPESRSDSGSTSPELIVPGYSNIAYNPVNYDSDQDLSEDIINQIVKKAPLAAKKAREVGYPNVLDKVEDTAPKLMVQKDVEVPQIAPELKMSKIMENVIQQTTEREIVTIVEPSVQVQEQQKLDDGADTGLPDWVLNPSLIDDPVERRDQTEFTSPPASPDKVNIPGLDIIATKSALLNRNLIENRGAAEQRSSTDLSPSRKGSPQIGSTTSTIGSLASSEKSWEADTETESKDEVLQESVLSALHSNKEGSSTKEPATKKESEFTLFWNLALHYLLPIRCVIDAEIRELPEDEKAAEPDKKSGGNLKPSTKNRFHPYKKEAQIKALKAYRDYRQLPNMSEVNYKRRLDSFCATVRDIIGKPLHASEGRFLNYSFKRSTLADVDEAKRIGDQDEKEEFQWTEKDIPEFQEKSKIVCEDEDKIDRVDDLERSIYDKGDKDDDENNKRKDNKSSMDTSKEHKARHKSPSKDKHSGSSESRKSKEEKSSKRPKKSSKSKGREEHSASRKSDELLHTKFKEKSQMHSLCYGLMRIYPSFSSITYSLCNYILILHQDFLEDIRVSMTMAQVDFIE